MTARLVPLVIYRENEKRVVGSILVDTDVLPSAPVFGSADITDPDLLDMIYTFGEYSIGFNSKEELDDRT